jgi:hypothetical protein
MPFTAYGYNSQVRPVYGHGYSVARYGMDFHLAMSLRQLSPKDRLQPMLRELIFDEDGEARVDLPRYSSQRLDRQLTLLNAPVQASPDCLLREGANASSL